MQPQPVPSNLNPTIVSFVNELIKLIIKKNHRLEKNIETFELNRNQQNQGPLSGNSCGFIYYNDIGQWRWAIKNKNYVDLNLFLVTF